MRLVTVLLSIILLLSDGSSILQLYCTHTPIISFPITGNPSIEFYTGQDPCTVLTDYCKHLLYMSYTSCIEQILPQLIKQFTQAWEAINELIRFTPQFFINCEPLQINYSQIVLFNSDYLTDYVPPLQYRLYRNSSQIVTTLITLLKRAMKRDSQALIDFNNQRNELELTDPERVSLYTQAILLLPSNLFIVDQLGLSLIYIGRRDLATRLYQNAVTQELWGNVMQRPVSKYVKGLTAKPWHTPADYPCVKVLEKGTIHS